MHRLKCELFSFTQLRTFSFCCNKGNALSKIGSTFLLPIFIHIAYVVARNGSG